MSYSINQLSKISGVSVRTLHYYDHIDLLKPAFVKENGYRVYDQKELVRLQQILFFRELEFSLESIKEMMSSKNFKPLEAMVDQKKMLELKKERLEKIIQSITNSIEHMKNHKKMKDEELYNSLSKQKLEEYQAEAQARWGNTEAYKQSVERTKNWDKNDVKKSQEEIEQIYKELFAVMEKDVSDSEVQKIVEKLYRWISQFYDVPMEMFRGLGKMYVEDLRFKANFDKYHPDLAQFTSDAMHAYADEHDVKN